MGISDGEGEIESGNSGQGTQINIEDLVRFLHRSLKVIDSLAHPKSKSKIIPNEDPESYTISIRSTGGVYSVPDKILGQRYYFGVRPEENITLADFRNRYQEMYGAMPDYKSAIEMLEQLYGIAEPKQLPLFEEDYDTHTARIPPGQYRLNHMLFPPEPE